MKGPFDWLEVLHGLARAGIDFEATWLGDGSQRPEMLRRIAQLGLEGRVTAPGFVPERATLLDALRQAHLFLFCHKTPELPRCLIEALISACPIVGYGSAYPRDLVAAEGGGLFVPIGDVAALSGQVAALAAERPRLQDLIARAARAGAPFSDRGVFRHRSELIKTFL